MVSTLKLPVGIEMIVKRNLLDNLGLSFNITFGLYQINNDRESIKKNG